MLEQGTPVVAQPVIAAGPETGKLFAMETFRPALKADVGTEACACVCVCACV